MEQVVTYLRVSTQRQHRTGLGLDAQRALTVSAEYVEAESGKGADALDRRLQLAAALAAAKAAKCSVVLPSSTGFRATGLCGRPNGPASAVHCCRAWAGCRSNSCCTFTRLWPKKNVASYLSVPRLLSFQKKRQPGSRWETQSTWLTRVLLGGPRWLKALKPSSTG